MMKLTQKYYSNLAFAILSLMSLSLAPGAQAGLQGSFVNSAGSGKIVATIVYAGVTNVTTSPSGTFPCAAINPTPTFTCTTIGKLPPGTPTSVYLQASGKLSFVISHQEYTTDGATADNPKLEARLGFPVDPADCASLSLDTSATLAGDGKSGIITANIVSTAGTAVWVRGFEAPDNQLPADVTDLEANGRLLFDMLLLGPLNMQVADCTALNIPFTTKNGTDKLFLVVDTIAKSTRMEITCPHNLAFACDEAVVYPEVTVKGGCGQVTVNYDPPAELLPAKVSTVTATATDEAGNKAVCTFVVDNSAKGIPLTIACPGNVVYACDEAVVYPVPTVGGSCKGFTVGYNPPANALPIGVTQVTVTATDSTGRTATCTFMADNSAKGIPFTIACPGNVVFACDATPAYPAATVSGACKSFTVAYNPPANALPVGTTPVTVTATDSTGRTATCTFTATRQSLAFNGFYPPISGTGGSCSVPLRTVNGGSIIPVKFDLSCGGSPSTGGQPTLRILKYPNCNTTPQLITGGNFQLVASVWHFNWDTTGLHQGVYQIIAHLPDGSEPSAFITLKAK